MFSAKFGFILRVGALAGLVGLLVFAFGFPHGSTVRAAPVFQDTPGYDGPTEDVIPTDSGSQGYDGPQGETPNSPVESPTPASGPTQEMTPTETSTAPVDAFRTEDAEMNGSQATLAATETPGSTITPYPTATVLKKTPRPTSAATVVKGKDGFIPDWGLFWIGFSIPVLGACGVALYLVDRRPDLFRRGK